MALCLEHISKSYDGRQVLHDFSACLERGGIYCLMGASGIGKTTLLRILMGLEQPDAGRIVYTGGDGAGGRRLQGSAVPIGAVFQENRLFEFADAWKNVELAAGRAGQAKCDVEALLFALLEKEAWHRPVSELSGGMRRRVSVARALASPCSLLVMDEPFAGLDEATKQGVIQTVLAYRADRTLLVVTHQEEDAALLGAQKVFQL